ncbi:M20/M25/M40 family metallo-hydrolase [bacterium]|nr:M20/M25/M40 family metallo-hydrolase [bacterium]
MTNLIKSNIYIKEEEIIVFLKKLVEQNTFTQNISGINKMADFLISSMPKSFKHTINNENKNFAPHHIFTKKGKTKKSLILAGHLDTLWETESPFKKMSRTKDRLTGPAVFDMKGGLTVLVWTLKILDICGLLEDLSITVLFNSDEEVGSISSQKIYPKLKKETSSALVYEGSELGGTIVVKRIGIANFTLEVTGKSAHSGLFKGEKESAIVELAKRIPWLESFNIDRDKLTVNVGKISGGVATNVIPDKAECAFEIRFWKNAYLKEVLEEIKKDISTPIIKGCRLKLKETNKPMPPLDSPKTEVLFDIVKRTALALNQKVIPQGRNGGSDANWLTSVGIPSIDGLGPIGALGRTSKEYILTKSLFDRIELSANLLLLPELYTFS